MTDQKVAIKKHKKLLEEQMVSYQSEEWAEDPLLPINLGTAILQLQELMLSCKWLREDLVRQVYLQAGKK